MQINQLPAKFPIPFGNNAASGTIRTIPQASQIAIAAGAASLTDGFPPVTLLPVGSGGTPPFGQDFNGILNWITSWSRWQGAGGTVQYDQTFSQANSGYPFGAILASTTSGKLWLCTADNNTTNPDSAQAANWLGLSPSAAKAIFNVIAITNSTRTAASGSTSGLNVTALSGITYNKVSPTSTIIVWASYQTYTTTPAGAITSRLNVGSGYDEAGLSNGFTPSGSSQPISLTNSPEYFIQGVGNGPQSIVLQFRRNDNASWTTVINPTSVDMSGYPTPNTTKFIFAEVETM